MTVTPLGNFEKLAKPYQSARRGFDLEVFEALVTYCGELSGKKVLDVGCGTGIATRQLAEYGASVIGCDLSEAMIREAQSIDGIKYIVAPTDSLPFENGAFEIVTAFSAFHWFCDNKSVQEIKRVLQKDGVFLVVNKHDIGGIRKDVVPLFKKYSNKTTGKDNYDPEQTLKESGFINVESVVIKGTETYSFDEASLYLQSIALWNNVPEEQRPSLLSEVENFCRDTQREGGQLVRHIETIVLFGLNV